MSINLFSPVLDRSWDNDIVPNAMPMDVELIEDPCPLTREELEWFFERFSRLAAALQNEQIPKIEKYIRSMLAHESFAFCSELLDRLPEAIARPAVENSRVELMRILGNQEHSRAMALLQIACMKPPGNTLQILKSLFITSMSEGICSQGEFSRAMKVLFASQHSAETINFVLGLESPSFEAVMRALYAGGVFVEKDSQSMEWIVHFLRQRFERVFQWLLAQDAQRLLSFVEHQSLVPVVRENLAHKLQTSQFQFVFSLVMAHSRAPRGVLIASIPHWVEEHQGRRTNFVHWLYVKAGPEVYTCLCSLIDALPCGELFQLWSALDVNGKALRALSQERHNQVLPYLATHLLHEWDRATRRGLSFQETLTFHNLRLYDFLTLTAEQFIQGVSSSQDVACRDFVRYYHELERGWLCVEHHQNERRAGYPPARHPVHKDSLIYLAIQFAAGPLVFAETLQLRAQIELRMQAAIVSASASYSHLRKDFSEFRTSLRQVTCWAIERGIEALRHQDVSMDSIRPFLARRLALPHLEKLVEIVERSHDLRAHETLVALREKLQFWRQFLSFVDSTSQARNVTFEQVTRVYQNLSGMSWKALSGQLFPFSNLVNVMAISTDGRCRQIARRYATISHATYGSVSFETEAPPEASTLHEAYFIEITLPAMHRVADCFLGRAETKLLHPLQYCPGNRRVYLLSRFAYAASFNSGTYKMATPAIELSQDDPLHAATKIHLFTVGPKWLSLGTYEAEMTHFRGVEIPLMAELGAHPGFLGFRSLVDYTYERSFLMQQDIIVHASVRKVSMVVDCAQKIRRVPLAANYSMLEQIMIGREVCLAMDALHARGRIHGDFKTGNCMIVPERQERGRIGAIVIDFGFTEQVANGHPIALIGAASYNSGIYGSVIMTAPELLGVRNFQGDHFKVDAFAVGFFLYALKYGQDPSWGHIAQDYRDGHFLRGPVQLRSLLEQTVQQDIARLRRSLQGPEATDHNVRYTNVVCGLLDPHPADRWTVYQAAYALNTLLMELTPPIPRNLARATRRSTRNRLQ